VINIYTEASANALVYEEKTIAVYFLGLSIGSGRASSMVLKDLRVYCCTPLGFRIGGGELGPQGLKPIRSQHNLQY